MQDRSRPSPYRVALLGSGNWGTAISRIIGTNVKKFPDLFVPEVNMWVYEEIVNGRKLTEIINETHENVKYLPDIKIPENIIAVPDVLEAVKNANLLVFVLPHQFVKGLCIKLKEHLTNEVYAISLIKGMAVKDNKPELISEVIHDILDINVSVLSGANIANEVAKEEFSEATIGSTDSNLAKIWKNLFHTSYFRINTIDDVAGVELCGALKNVVALAAGFCDGLGFAANAKAAVIRCGLEEMRKFAQTFYPNIKPHTFFESCGIADLIVTCYSGRNRKVAEAFVCTKKSFDELEQELLNGQKLQGTLTAKEVYEILSANEKTKEFPLFLTIYRISFEGLDPWKIISFDDMIESS
jgi:glycerol-3-phosphate dehydrogenase (NAD+)